MFSVRLACVKRAASVRPEPGSNSLFKLYIQTLRVFISILAITIRSQLPLWFFCLFWLLKVPISWNLKGFFACSALFNFQDTFEAAFALQLLYYITFRSFCQVNILWTEVQPVFFSLRFSPWPAFLFYHILSILSSKHFMNWSSFHIFFSFSSTACPKQSAYSFYHTSNVLSSELFLNNFNRSSVDLPIRFTVSAIHKFPCLSLSCDSFIIISHFFCYVK